MLLNFSSGVFLGVFAAQQKIQEQADASTDSCALITIMNADGIYLATYAALLLNLKLIRINYYHEEARQVPVSEVSLFEIHLILVDFSAFTFESRFQGAICGGSTRIRSVGLSLSHVVVRTVSTSARVQFIGEVWL